MLKIFTRKVYLTRNTCLITGVTVAMKPRVLSEQCATCIGRPGNVMNLRPGRVKGLVNGAIQQGSQGIPCHETLSYGQHPETGEAMCRWFYDTFGHLCNYVRIMQRLGGFEEVTIKESKEKS